MKEFFNYQQGTLCDSLNEKLACLSVLETAGTISLSSAGLQYNSPWSKATFSL
jgi:hypothetical protein